MIWLGPDGWGEAATGPAGDEMLLRFQHLTRELADGTFADLFHKDVSGGQFKRQARDFVMAYRNGGLRGVANKLGRLRSVARRSRWAHPRRFRWGPEGGVRKKK